MCIFNIGLSYVSITRTKNSYSNIPELPANFNQILQVKAFAQGWMREKLPQKPLHRDDTRKLPYPGC